MAASASRWRSHPRLKAALANRQALQFLSIVSSERWADPSSNPGKGGSLVRAGEQGEPERVYRFMSAHQDNRKAGVAFLDLVPAGYLQRGVFDQPDDARSLQRMRAIDLLNRRFDRGTIGLTGQASAKPGGFGENSFRHAIQLTERVAAGLGRTRRLDRSRGLSGRMMFSASRADRVAIARKDPCEASGMCRSARRGSGCALAKPPRLQFFGGENPSRAK
jgi:hypothetical protein